MRLAVLLSGRGSNFVAIHEAIRRKELVASIEVVISNRPGAAGIAVARELGYLAITVDQRKFGRREEHERELINVIEEARVDLVVLAGYMRALTKEFIEPFRNRIVNIHPSLLPAFPGVHAQQQALEHGVKVTGCTVHLVDETLDGGPIIEQRVVPVLDGDSVETLSARILEQEHQAYPEALRKLARGYRVVGRQVVFGPDAQPG